MIKDSVVEEIRKYRAEHAARYDNDLKKICKALRRREKTSKKEFVHFGPKLLQSKHGGSRQDVVVAASMKGRTLRS